MSEQEQATAPNAEDQIGAETALIGTLLYDGEAMLRVAPLVTSSDFYRPKYRAVFAAMEALFAEGKAIDRLTVTEKLRASGALEAAGGSMAIVKMLGAGPPDGNVEEWALLINGKAVIRRLIEASRSVITNALDPHTSPQDALDFAESKIFALTGDRPGVGLTPMGTIAEECYELVERMVGHEPVTTGVRSGFPSLDTMTGGFQPGDLILVAARPGFGKSSFALQIAEQAALLDGKRVAVFSLEMTKVQLFWRTVCGMAQINSRTAAAGNVGADWFMRAVDAVGRLSHAPIWIDDTSSMTVTEIRAKARRLAAEAGLDMIIIDYLQIMGSSSKRDSRVREVSEISAGLKGLAKELNVPVIALSQLSRATESRDQVGGGYEPRLSDLRDSGSLEQDADVVLFLYRPDMYYKTREKGSVSVIIGKQRNGPTGSLRLAFCREWTRFGEGAPPLKKASGA